MTLPASVHPLDECFEYLQRSAGQFHILEPNSPIVVNAQMLRSIYYRLGCLKFGIPFTDIAHLGG